MNFAAKSFDRQSVGYQAGLLGGFTLLAAALLVIGDLATEGAIEQRHAEDLKASLTQVIPPEIHDNDLLANPLVIKGDDGQDVVVYRALKGLDVTGVAYRIVGFGYAGEIDSILGLDAQGRIIGVRVLAHAETPGLGDKIEVAKDDWILGFNGRSLGDPPLERWGVKKDGGDFDQFSGATITPRGVVRSIREGLQFFAEHRDALTAPAEIGTADADQPTRSQP
ncbi:electron transport complex, RnfABCDGE type, G subunit [Thiorhodococcus drewsii AZ1]|uniref:Ion-translocating oxidoreductase complex subunit G n=1 Tax=Thiorhodococcus drewsii AZ1 TaxID=765913 RepID=G2E801_9GAMM|nr:RnfABCDGE type electron transport complex subunit G [Thiorhodococcus drewsii]EGV27778.1 electron transport complex, RnfABCDGE type, G subunit [Thiorhodococcus drewsii AZ1]